MVSLTSLVLTTILTWPHAEVTYRFDATVPPEDRRIIERALALWEQPASPVHFRRVEGWWQDLAWLAGIDRSVVVREDPRLPVFARTTLGAGSYRELVFNPAKSSPDWLEADLAHEWGHVLGLTHEHQRSDRDRYVAFPPGFLEDLPPDRAGDYVVDPDDPPPGADRPYDYVSLMHYSSNIDGNRMVRRDTGAFLPGARRPSEGDGNRLKSLYPLAQEAP